MGFVWIIICLVRDVIIGVVFVIFCVVFFVVFFVIFYIVVIVFVFWIFVIIYGFWINDNFFDSKFKCFVVNFFVNGWVVKSIFYLVYLCLRFIVEFFLIVVFLFFFFIVVVIYYFKCFRGFVCLDGEGVNFFMYGWVLCCILFVFMLLMWFVWVFVGYLVIRRGIDKISDWW